MASIYDLTADYLVIFKGIEDAIANGNDVDLNEAIKALDLQDDIAKKVINIGRYIKNTDAETVAISAELARLRAKKTANDKKVNALKVAAINAMQLLNIDKIPDPVLPVRLQKNSQYSVNIESVADLPHKYLKVVYEADKKALLADKDSLNIKGVTITKGQHIRFG